MKAGAGASSIWAGRWLEGALKAVSPGLSVPYVPDLSLLLAELLSLACLAVAS